MPIFTYKCRDCGFEDDVLVRSSDQTPSETKCPKCGLDGAFVRTISTNTSFQLKGDGWYKSSSQEK